MNTITDLFPSKYLRATDLKTAKTRVTITGARVETLGRGAQAEQKLVVSFRETSKPLVLNKTNATRIAELAGSPNWDNWPNVAITLCRVPVEFQGRVTDGVRIEAAPRTAAPADDIAYAMPADEAVL